MAMACSRLFTLPPFPDRRVPFFLRCIALFTDLPAARPYLAIVSSKGDLLRQNPGSENREVSLFAQTKAMRHLLYLRLEKTVAIWRNAAAEEKAFL
jgi:hypothetical protein